MQLSIYSYQYNVGGWVAEAEGVPSSARRESESEESRMGRASDRTHLLERQDPERGQSLFELVVAIAISALIIAAIVSLTTNSIQNSTFSKNKALAATYAEQASEWLRGQRDSDINTFITHAVTPAWCLSDLGWTQPSANPAQDCVATKISGTNFSRYATFEVTTLSGKTIVLSNVVVLWTDSQGLHEVANATNLADWRQR